MLSLMPRGYLHSESSEGLFIELATREENSRSRPTKSASTQEWEMHREIMLVSVSGRSLPSTISLADCLSIHLFRLPILTLIPQRSCQVVHAHQYVRMLFAQHRLHQLECLPMHLFRLLIFALTAQH
jgi:hypothetical protein